MKDATKRHMGPGKKAINIYADKQFHERVKTHLKKLREQGFRLSVSGYFELLATRDMMGELNSPATPTAATNQSADVLLQAAATAEERKRQKGQQP